MECYEPLDYTNVNGTRSLRKVDLDGYDDIPTDSLLHNNKARIEYKCS